MLFLSLASCKHKEDKRLNSFIINELKKNTDTLNFSHFNKVTWNQMYIIPPYSNFKNYDATLLKYQNEIDNYDIELRTCLNLKWGIYYEKCGSVSSLVLPQIKRCKQSLQS